MQGTPETLLTRKSRPVTFDSSPKWAGKTSLCHVLPRHRRAANLPHASLRRIGRLLHTFSPLPILTVSNNALEKLASSPNEAEKWGGRLIRAEGQTREPGRLLILSESDYSLLFQGRGSVVGAGNPTALPLTSPASNTRVARLQKCSLLELDGPKHGPTNPQEYAVLASGCPW